MFLNRAFFHYITTGKPWVTAKYAMSLDGCIATSGGESQWITSPHTRETSHQLRNISDGILVGRGTAVKDNPQLTTRLQGQDCKHPTRIVMDSQGRTPPRVKLFDPDTPGSTWLATTDAAPEFVRKTLEHQGVEVLICPKNADGKVDVDELLKELGSRDVTTLMVEGGGQVLGSFFTAGAVNEVWAFIGARLIGGEKAPGPIGGDRLEIAGAGPASEYLRNNNPGTRRPDKSHRLRLKPPRESRSDLIAKAPIAQRSCFDEPSCSGLDFARLHLGINLDGDQDRGQRGPGLHLRLYALYHRLGGDVLSA